MFELVPFERRNHGAMYNPFRDFEEMEKSFFGSDAMGEFKTDIKDSGDAYVLEADLPGFKKEDIKIDLDGEYLTIRATRKGESDEKDKKGNFVRRERCFGSFSRSFDVSGVKAEDIKAKYADGVLTLTMPKKQAKVLPEARHLEIE